MNQRSESTSVENQMRVLHVAEDRDRVCVGELIERLGSRAWGPLLVVPSILVMTPLGAIPGVAVGTGILLITISVQILIAGRTLWLPERLERFRLPADKLNAAIDRCEPVLRRIDMVVGPRLEFLAAPPAHYFIAVLVMLLAASMFPLALVPFGVLVPAAGVVLLGLGLMTRDGVMLLFGFGFALGTFGLGIWLFAMGHLPALF
jgi:hypothetical protein